MLADHATAIMDQSANNFKQDIVDATNLDTKVIREEIVRHVVNYLLLLTEAVLI